MIRAKIIGAGGYGGVGMTELLLGHPEAEIACLVDVADIGKPISDIYLHLRGHCDMPIIDPSDPVAAEPVDVVFLATPDGVGMKLAGNILESGAKVIDYSGDFRFNSRESYAEYARRIGRPVDHVSPDLLPTSVYGLAELHRDDITQDRRLVGNPGCFAVSCILGLAPAVEQALLEPGTMICDCKTGVSGAGKKPAAAFHYPARYQTMNAYRLSGHQHVCEIERELGLLCNAETKITFTAQVVPVCRGIMSTLYGKLTKDLTEDRLFELYCNRYADDAFVKVSRSDVAASSSDVRGTNCCSLVVSVDPRTNIMRVVSYIDNLVKGQAGNALQNMNLLFGLPETMGLDRPGQYP
jgi:N-acetyl-gamma-glutamyl-phosphate reductase